MYLFDEKQKAAKELNDALDAEAARLFKDFSQLEREAWPFEYPEYLRWLEGDPKTETEYMDLIAEARGISRNEYLELTHARVESFKLISAKLIGKLQAARSKIRMAETIEEIEEAKAAGLLELQTVFL